MRVPGVKLFTSSMKYKLRLVTKIKDHRVNYTTGRNLCNGRNLVELVAVKCTTPVNEDDV